MLTLTRSVRFSAGHRYCLDELSEVENQRLYGDCARPHGHGHDYRAEVTVSGEIDKRTGMVLNIAGLKPLLQHVFVDAWDGEFLTRQHPAMGGLVPTTENLARLAWRRLAQRLRNEFPHARLERVRIYESDTLWGDAVRGPEGGPMIELTRTYEFAAAHRLHSPALSDAENEALFGKCNNPHGHGHNYKLDVTVAHPVDERTGLMADLVAVDAVVDALITNRYDHRHLNYDVDEFRKLNPTSENLVRVIWERLDGKLPGVRLVRVTLRETDRNTFSYDGGDSS